jgi:hypothetical protein
MKQVLGLIAVACAAIAALVFAIQVRSRQTDSFPLLSSFRTLPEGSSVLYDALGQTPGITVERNTRPFGALPFSDSTILLLDVQPFFFSGNGEFFAQVEDLAGKGNRVVIALSPHRRRFIAADPKQTSDSLKRWSIKLGFFRDTDIREAEEPLIPGWPMYFEAPAGWHDLRKENGHPVVIWREQGKGSIVLVANPYLFSNAAMVEDRQTPFLLSALGPAQRVVFDETHFGIQESGSIAALVRRYRLQGLVLGLLITAGLFIWKSAAGFPPVPPRRQTAVTGEDSTAAFVNLLRRNIRREDVVKTCVEQWRKVNHRDRADIPAALAIATETGNTAAVYAKIQSILGAKSKKS